MIKRFISLEWKKFTRSSSFSQSLAIKIIMIFLALYFMGSFLLVGVGAYFMLEELIPGKDPLVVVNNWLVYWFLFDLIYRYFLQKLPVMNVQPLMPLPIKRKSVIHFLLGKTGFAFYNILPLFFLVPFSVVLLTKDYATLNVITWFFALVFLELCVNYLNFLVNKNQKVFYGLVIVLFALVGLQYFGVYSITDAAGFVFNKLYTVWYAFLIPLLLLVRLYRTNFTNIRKQFYLDDRVQEKTKAVKTKTLNWVDRFGEMAVFLKNDMRMIWRNKRPKQVLLMAFLFLFYGLIFFTQDIYSDKFYVIAFASIFVTGGFLISFGQQVPAWDSQYYKLLMSQNIPYRKYLESKWSLMVFATGLSLLLSVPYAYFGWKIFAMIVAGAIFNIGANSFVVLWGGSFRRVPIELNVKAKAFSNMQGINMAQILVSLPVLIFPVLVFTVPYLLFNFQAGVLTLALIGILGLVFKKFLLTQIEKTFQKGKYKMIAAFEERS